MPVLIIAVRCGGGANVCGAVRWRWKKIVAVRWKHNFLSPRTSLFFKLISNYCRFFSLMWVSIFLAYVICKENYSFSRVVFLFFQSKIANSFYSKINDSSGVRTKVSRALGPGSSLCRAKYFYDFTDICQIFHSNGSHGTVGRTTGFWSGRSGFESLSCQIFLWFHWHFSEIPMLLMAQWVGQQGSKAVGTGSNPSLYLFF